MNPFCYDCNSIKSPCEMYSITRNGDRGLCKKCHGTKCYSYKIGKQAQFTPGNFSECDDCDRMFSRYRPGRPDSILPRKERKACPYCNSVNIHTLENIEMEAV